MNREKVTFWAVIVVIPTLGLSYLYVWGPEAQKPSEYLMREHIVGTMTNEQLRTLASTAKDEIERKTKLNEKFSDDFSKRERERSKKCADEAYKIRNTIECDPPLILLGAPQNRIPTMDEQIDRLILGECQFMLTVREARQNGCLPKF